MITLMILVDLIRTRPGREKTLSQLRKLPMTSGSIQPLPGATARPTQRYAEPRHSAVCSPRRLQSQRPQSTRGGCGCEKGRGACTDE
jgi:hypothetical protein